MEQQVELRGETCADLVHEPRQAVTSEMTPLKTVMIVPAVQEDWCMEVAAEMTAQTLVGQSLLGEAWVKFRIVMTNEMVVKAEAKVVMIPPTP